MPDLLITLLIGAAVLIAVGALVYYLLITTEGVYLGQRVVTYLYDVYARRYDRIKGFTAEYEQLFVALPLLESIGDVELPLILDVATGTGRVLSALHACPYFAGHVVGLDHSLNMLDVAREHVSGFTNPDMTTSLLRGDALRLPFPADTFHAVVCLEALEFLPSPEAALREMARVLKPGYPLFTTRRRGSGAWLMPGRARRRMQIVRFLVNECGLVAPQLQPWQIDYEQIWAFKPDSAHSPPDDDGGEERSPA